MFMKLNSSSGNEEGGVWGGRGSLPSVLKAAERLHARLIVVERPGMGLSTYKPRRQILDWVDDVMEFADALHLEKFSVIGYSSGGPYALACALRIPERLNRVALISGDSPHSDPRIHEILDDQTRQLDWLADKAPLLFNLMLWFTSRKNRNASAENAIASIFPGELPQSDRDALSDPQVPEWFDAMTREGVRNGTRGAARDMTLVVRH